MVKPYHKRKTQKKLVIKIPAQTDHVRGIKERQRKKLFRVTL